MSVLGIGLVALGIVLIAVGYGRAKRPWDRYRALKAQDENVARYEAWRGGRRETSATGASVAMQLLRRRAQLGGLVLLAGFALVFAGFLLR